MYRLKLISEQFGVDDSGPLHPSQEQARRAALVMWNVYRGQLRIEIHRVVICAAARPKSWRNYADCRVLANVVGGNCLAFSFVG